MSVSDISSFGSSQGGGHRVSPEGLDLIKQFEGFREHAYPDALHGWAVATIGYGTTVFANGNRVNQGDHITLEQAQDELIYHIQKHILPALNGIPEYDKMNRQMQGALQSFAYNLGAHFYGGQYFQTISRVLRERDWGQMRAAMCLYVNPGTPVEVGLRRRRQAEADLWEAGLRNLGA